MKKIYFLIALFNCAISMYAQQKRTSIDVIHYNYNIHLNDEDDSIEGTAQIKLYTLKPLQQFSLDLQSIQSNGKGMIVVSAQADHLKKTTHSQDLIHFVLNKWVKANTLFQVEIKYKGIPSDGLIISKTKYGRRAFFADHWPQRAHCWLPCIDHPSDKASVDFTITAPNHYKVIANGLQKSRIENNGHGFATTYYHESMKIPTKVMTIGVADFVVEQSGVSNNIPVFSWIYPEDSAKGFYDFKVASGILDFFSAKIGSYAYQKLANVQSKTRFGGLENANAIFYAEDAVRGNRSNEQLLAHEIAHQWFGNMATESDWPHLWLSEGFATYFSMLYMEHQYGRDTLIRLLQKNKIHIIGNNVCETRPVVDNSQKDPMNLLNRNSYEKGGWILHMLRSQLGDSVFFKSIKKYYATYRGKNAGTEDFQNICETVSGQQLDPFFKQWLYTPGIPGFKIFFQEESTKGLWKIGLEQNNGRKFQFPLTVDLLLSDGTKLRKQLQISSIKEIWEFQTSQPIIEIIIDPEQSLLYGKAFNQTLQ